MAAAAAAAAMASAGAMIFCGQMFWGTPSIFPPLPPPPPQSVLWTRHCMRYNNTTKRLSAGDEPLLVSVEPHLAQ